MKKKKTTKPNISTINNNDDGLIALNQQKADIVYVDPPWDINQTGSYGAINHYELMSLESIKAMPVSDLCKNNAVCFLWVPNGLVPEGLEVLKSWGFTYRNSFYWVRSQMGLGYPLRNCSETLLLGIRGKMTADFRAQPNWEFMPRQEHSHKPEEMYAIIERLYQNRSYIELFARKRPSNKGWRIWGLEAEGGSDLYIPGYPVPKYTDKVQLAKREDMEGGKLPC